MFFRKRACRACKDQAATKYQKTFAQPTPCARVYSSTQQTAGISGQHTLRGKAASENQRNLSRSATGARQSVVGRLCEFLGGGELVKRCDPMLEARVMNQLQKWKKSGQTTEQLENTLKTPQAKILIVLELYRAEGHVRKSQSGVWTLGCQGPRRKATAAGRELK